MYFSTILTCFTLASARYIGDYSIVPGRNHTASILPTHPRPSITLTTTHLPDATCRDTPWPNYPIGLTPQNATYGAMVADVKQSLKYKPILGGLLHLVTNDDDKTNQVYLKVYDAAQDLRPVIDGLWASMNVTDDGGGAPVFDRKRLGPPGGWAYSDRLRDVIAAGGDAPLRSLNITSLGYLSEHVPDEPDDGLVYSVQMTDPLPGEGAGAGGAATGNAPIAAAIPYLAGLIADSILRAQPLESPITVSATITLWSNVQLIQRLIAPVQAMSSDERARTTATYSEVRAGLARLASGQGLVRLDGDADVPGGLVSVAEVEKLRTRVVDCPVADVLADGNNALLQMNDGTVETAR